MVEQEYRDVQQCVCRLLGVIDLVLIVHCSAHEVVRGFFKQLSDSCSRQRGQTRDTNSATTACTVVLEFAVETLSLEHFLVQRPSL